MRIVDRLIGRASPTAALRRAISLQELGRGPQAFELLTHAAKAGIVEAEYRIARCYLEGLGVPPSRPEGARWLARAAAHGWLDAQVLLSALCLQGLVAAPAGEAANTGARVSSLFETAAPANPDFESAQKWASRAAEAGW